MQTSAWHWVCLQLIPSTCKTKNSFSGVDGKQHFNISLKYQSNSTRLAPLLPHSQIKRSSSTSAQLNRGLCFTCRIKTFQLRPKTTPPKTSAEWVIHHQRRWQETRRRRMWARRGDEVTTSSLQTCHLSSAGPQWNYLKRFVECWCDEEGTPGSAEHGSINASVALKTCPTAFPEAEAVSERVKGKEGALKHTQKLQKEMQRTNISATENKAFLITTESLIS